MSFKYLADPLFITSELALSESEKLMDSLRGRGRLARDGTNYLCGIIKHSTLDMYAIEVPNERTYTDVLSISQRAELLDESEAILAGWYTSEDDKEPVRSSGVE